MNLSRLDDVTKTLASIVELGRRGDVMTPPTPDLFADHLAEDSHCRRAAGGAKEREAAAEQDNRIARVMMA